MKRVKNQVASPPILDVPESVKFHSAFDKVPEFKHDYLVKVRTESGIKNDILSYSTVTGWDLSNSPAGEKYLEVLEWCDTPF